MLLPRQRRLFLRCALVAAGLLLCLLGLEAWARLFNPFGISLYRDNVRYFNEAIEFPPDGLVPLGRIFEHKKELELPLLTFRVVTDAAGLRSGARDEPRAGPRSAENPRRWRILFLGDSVTFAWGVDDVDSWVRRIERDARGPAGQPLACLNSGHPQYNTIEEADWLAAHAAALEPDVVVLTFVVNDLQDCWGKYQALMAAPASAAANSPTWVARLGERLPLWFPGLNGLALLARERRALRATAAVADPESTEEYERGWPPAEAALERVLAWCRERAIAWVVLDHSAPRISSVRRWCEARGVPWHDLQFSEAELQQGVTLSPADAHANPLGNQYLAHRAMAALRAEKLLAP